jgi:hypothetical protein
MQSWGSSTSQSTIRDSRQPTQDSRPGLLSAVPAGLNLERIVLTQALWDGANGGIHEREREQAKTRAAEESVLPAAFVDTV